MHKERRTQNLQAIEWEDRDLLAEVEQLRNIIESNLSCGHEDTVSADMFYANLVKYKMKNPAAISHKTENGGWEIWCNFSRPDIVLGKAETEEKAWKAAFDYICQS